MIKDISVLVCRTPETNIYHVAMEDGSSVVVEGRTALIAFVEAEMPVEVVTDKYFLEDITRPDIVLEVVDDE